MSVSTCPIAVINAPIERVQELLAEPANYNLWWNAHTRSIYGDLSPKAASTGAKSPCQSGRIQYPSYGRCGG